MIFLSKGIGFAKGGLRTKNTNSSQKNTKKLMQTKIIVAFCQKTL
jgi:hypothetical protein